MDWQRFVIDHGWKARANELGAVVGLPTADILRFRATRTCSRLKKAKRFGELFSLWHGRAPRDDEWPRPRRAGGHGYEWQPPELALLASLVGRLGKRQIAKVLTKRLIERTRDKRARRTENGVQMYMGHLGLMTTDVIGGITVVEAGSEVGGYYMVWNAIKRGQLPSFRVGSVVAIPHAAWAAWKAKRVFPPKDYVQLSTLKRPLSIKSDKLSEWARMGYIPTAVRCNPYGSRVRTTKFGTWYLSAKMAAQLLADRRAGRPMPWWGKPEPGNLSVTYKLWQERKHPATCKLCVAIWGPKGAPSSFAEYAERYHPLEFGQKRHLTRRWSPGLTVGQVAALTSRSWGGVRRAIDNGMLEATRTGARFYVSRTDATRWKARRCPMGSGRWSWLAIATAQKQYRFTRAQLRAFIKDGSLLSHVGTAGAMRGITYVSRHQCARLREKLGFTEEEAARRAKLTLARFRVLLKGVEWLRVGDGIPLQTLQAVIKRAESREGRTFEEAAAELGVTVDWIHERKDDGTIRVSRAKWDRRRYYITDPMFQRLMSAKKKPASLEQLGEDWLYSTDAEIEAGVSIGTIAKWARNGELERKPTRLGFRYHRAAIRARARRYWAEEVRFHRATPPVWMQSGAALRSQGAAAELRAA